MDDQFNLGTPQKEEPETESSFVNENTGALPTEPAETEVAADSAPTDTITTTAANEESANTAATSEPSTPMGEAPNTNAAADGAQKNEPYHSACDSYRFHAPDPDEPKPEEKSYNRNQYGERKEQTDYGYYHEQQNPKQNDYVNYSDPVGRSSRPNKPHKKPSGSMHGIVVGAAMAAIFGVVAAGVFFGLTRLVPQQSTDAAAGRTESKQESEITLGKKESTESEIGAVDPSEIEKSANKEAKAQEMTIPEVAKKVMPSMVAITNTSVQQYRDFFGEVYDRESVSAGSGIIVGETDEHLLIATNNHVISGSSDITVTFVDEAAISGTVQGSDADNDLAIVSVAKKDIPDATKKAIDIVEIGDSDHIAVGDGVVAIGNALGYGQSVSAGIVSAVGRQMKDSDGTVRNVIQTDASINPGNSGGALLNMKGQLIGINEAKLVDTKIEGVGYAIPMAIAEPILTNLGNKTSREKVSPDRAGYLGITCVTMPSQYTSSGYPKGVYINRITENGPAAAAGLEKGDIITAFDGSTIQTREELLSALTYYAEGETVSVSVSRYNEEQKNFEKKQVNVTLASREAAGITDSSTGNGGSTQQNPSGEFDSRNGYFGGSGSLFDIFR